MIKRWLLALTLLLFASPVWAQNPTCPTRSLGDSTNACASTAFVQQQFATPTLPFFITCPANQWVNSIGSLASVCAQPAIGNLAAIGANTVVGSIAGGAPIALTTAQHTTLVNLFTTSLSGAAPASGGGTVNFLRADGTWQPVTAASLTYTPSWSGAVAYTQTGVNANTVYMTDFMGATTCDGTNFIGGTGGVSSTTLTVASVTSGTLAVGQVVASGTTSTGVSRTIASLGTGTGGAGTYILNSAATIATGSPMSGGTNQLTNMQNFLTAVSVNGVGGLKTVTGVFAPGNCFVSGGTPTFTMNSSPLVQQYYLRGYGSTITPDPSTGIDGLFISRGTLSNFPDEQSGVTVEGLTINLRNNGNASWGFEFNNPHTRIRYNQVIAGDDGVTHNQVNLAAVYGHQSNSVDPNTGPFWSQIVGNVIKGTGTGVSTLPIAIRIDGQTNEILIAQNIINEATYGILVVNACATVNANCAAVANGVHITQNAFENLNTGVNFITSVPSLTQITSWTYADNRLENLTSAIDFTQVTQNTAGTPIAIGPNQQIGVTNYIVNPNNLLLQTYDGAWQNYTPATACVVGAGTFTGTTARYAKLGKTMHVELNTTLTAVGTCTTNGFTFNAPLISNTGGGFSGLETTVSGVAVNCFINPAATSVRCNKAAGTAMATNDHFILSGTYESQQ